MDDLDEIRKRIQQKKQQPKLTEKGFGKLYHFAISTMTIIALVLFGGCIVKSYPSLDVMTYIDQHILALLPKISLDQYEPVAQPIQYQVLGQNMYKNSDEYVYAFDNGVVIDNAEGKLTILYQNGISAIYSNFAQINVKKYDKITKNEKLGTYENQFQMVLKKDGALLKYEDVFS